VRTNNPAPQTPFLNWSTAAANIQDAIDAAVPGDLIVVSNGTYNFGGRAMFAAMTNRVVIDKAVTVQSVNGPAATTIAGLPGTGSYLSAGYRCVYLTNGAALMGFTLTNGATRIDTSYTDQVKEQYGGRGVVRIPVGRHLQLRDHALLREQSWRRGSIRAQFTTA